MSDKDFTINGTEYKVSKIDAMKQFHIVRRISPILAELAPSMSQIARMAKGDAKSEADKFEEFAKILAPIFLGLAKLSDTDANYVLYGLLGAIEKKQPTGNWAKLAQGDQLMFHDMELPIMLQAAGRAFAFNLSSFFAVLPQVS